MVGGRPVHGGVTPAELQTLGLHPAEVLDFSASISPIGPPETVWDAMREVDLSAYPDPQCSELRHKLAAYLSQDGPPGNSLTPENLLVGNGSTEIIHLLARAYLAPPSTGRGLGALIFTPTYGEYAGACRVQGASIEFLEAGPPPEFRWDLKEAIRIIEERRPSLIFLCNPNNPTGAYIPMEQVEPLARAAALTGSILVLDEAYAAFVDHPDNTQNNTMGLVTLGNIVVLRSMTKAYALTALRIGYSIASPEITAKLRYHQPDWSVNGLAQGAAAAVLGDPDYLDRSRAEVARAKEFLVRRLEALEFNVPPSTANFLLVEVGDAPVWRNRLARRGFFVRDCSSFGLPRFIRIGIRQLSDCQRLMTAIEALA